MRRLGPALVLAAAVLAAGGTAAPAQSISVGETRIDFDDPGLQPSTDRHRAFVEAYVSAVNSGRPSAMAALVHPASIDCLATDVARAFAATRLAQDVSSPIPQTAKIVIAPYAKGFGLPAGLETFASLPVQPTGILGISYSHDVRDEKGVLVRSTGRTILRPIIEGADGTEIVMHCLTAQGEQRLAERQKASPPSQQQQQR